MHHWEGAFWQYFITMGLMVSTESFFSQFSTKYLMYWRL